MNKAEFIEKVQKQGSYTTKDKYVPKFKAGKRLKELVENAS